MKIGHDGIVIVGAGQAGYQAAVSLRESGYDGRLVLLGDEAHLPYQRPPLSKAFLTGNTTDEALTIPTTDQLCRARIDFLAGARVLDIDRTTRIVRLQTGVSLPYHHLVLATGSRNRRLDAPDVGGIHSLRGLDDAVELRDRITESASVAII